MMKNSLLLAFFLLPLAMSGKDVSEKKTRFIPKVKVSGFVRSDVIFDSRQNVEAMQGGYTLFPKNVDLDANGNDINAAGSLRSVGVISRIQVSAQGPKMFGAQTQGVIEIDMAGGTGDGYPNEVRMRHAFIKWQWKNQSLLTGQAWHPLFVEESFPVVLNFNTGLPFQPFNRSPQIRYNQNIGSHVEFLAAAIFQNQYTSNGPQGATSKYQRDAKIPNFDLQFRFKSKNIFAGLGYDFLALQPYLALTDENELRYKTNKRLFSHRFMAFAKVSTGGFSLLMKTVMGQNLFDQLMPGGYAVRSIDVEKGEVTFTNSLLSASFANMRYNYKRFTAGVFVGYMKNLGFEHNPMQGMVFARSADVSSSWRIAPNLFYQLKNMQFGLEYEITEARYGDIDYQDRGNVKNVTGVRNNRIFASACYFF